MKNKQNTITPITKGMTEDLLHQLEKEHGRPDHGPTQVRTPEELRVGDLYILHGPAADPERFVMKMIQILGSPKKNGVQSVIFMSDTVIVPIRTFSNSTLNHPFPISYASLISLGLAKYPGSPGEYDPNRWLEDPEKMVGGHPNLTQREALQIIKKRMSSNQGWWKRLKR